jgi:hypothetical protein
VSTLVLRPSVLVLALLLSASTLWSAFTDGSIDITTALIRFLIAVPVAWLMLRVLAVATANHQDRSRAGARRPTAERTGAAVDSES